MKGLPEFKFIQELKLARKIFKTYTEVFLNFFFIAANYKGEAAKIWSFQE